MYKIYSRISNDAKYADIIAKDIHKGVIYYACAMSNEHIFDPIDEWLSIYVSFNENTPCDSQYMWDTANDYGHAVLSRGYDYSVNMNGDSGIYHRLKLEFLNCHNRFIGTWDLMKIGAVPAFPHMTHTRITHLRLQIPERKCIVL